MEGDASFGVDAQQAVVNSIADASAREETKRLALLATKREEDEFNKMEQTFVTDLGLATSDLPPWMGSTN